MAQINLHIVQPKKHLSMFLHIFSCYIKATMMTFIYTKVTHGRLGVLQGAEMLGVAGWVTMEWE